MLSWGTGRDLLRSGSFQSNGRQERGAAEEFSPVYCDLYFSFHPNYHLSIRIITSNRIDYSKPVRVDTQVLHGHKIQDDLDDLSHFGRRSSVRRVNWGFEKDRRQTYTTGVWSNANLVHGHSRKQPAQSQYLGDAVLFRYSVNTNSIGTACR